MTALYSGGRTGIEMQIFVGVAFAYLDTPFVQPGVAQIPDELRILSFVSIIESPEGLFHFFFGESINDSMPDGQESKPVLLLGERRFTIL